MSQSPDYAKRLQQLLRELKRRATPAEPFRLDPLRQLVYGFVLWEASRRQADRAYERLMKAVVDLNDLRVSDPAEIIPILGARYPRAEERALRLKQALNAVYRREHRMDLSRLAELTKRDARAYLDELEGIVPFVSACVALLALGAHAMPVDDPLRQRLARDGAVAPDATLEQVQSFLEYHVLAENAVETFGLLRAYVERPIRVNLMRPPAAGRRKKSSVRGTAGKAAARRAAKKPTAATGRKKPTRRKRPAG